MKKNSFCGYLFLIMLTNIIILLLTACSNLEPVNPTNTAEPSKIPTVNLPPLLKDSYSVEVVELPYTSQLFLDVYAPSAEGIWPVVVVLHGGDDNKDWTSDLSKKIAAQGAVVFTPSWRIKSEVYFYQGYEDVACSIRFARSKAHDYGGNPDRITVVGHSAGGGAAAAMFLAANGFEGDCLVSGGSSVPDALVGLDGVYDFRELLSAEIYAKDPEGWDLINPVFYLPSQQVNDDRVIYIINSSFPLLQDDGLSFQEDLIRVGFDPKLILLPNVNHTSIAWPAPDEVIQAVVDAMSTVD
ncbi:MAG: alpha/beta hydrolase [Anaerolineaceae bacterium]|nr:alpha/beta hydrolase [Anaerolineaceae bacterium]